MRWQGREESDNVEDRRGDSSGAPGGFGRGGGGLGGPGFRIARGGGVSGIVIMGVIALVLWMVGINPLPLLFGDGSIQSTQSSGGYSSGGASAPRADDEAAKFSRVVLKETEDVWSGIFQAAGQTYTKPTLVLFDGQIKSACGFAQSASGPFYCPGDQKVYIDLSFYNELDKRFGASGDFAHAYVLAHEVGHHVQNLLGILPRFNKMRQTMSEAQSNAMSVRVELQADCFAGVWGKYTDQKGLLEQGDLAEALNAAHQIGDDTLQKRSQGYVVPESFNHGTSDQRAKWFKRGFDSGRVDACDTFNNPV